MALLMVDGVHVHLQKTDVWCWCAVTEAIANFHGNPNVISQCQIASVVLGIDNCCEDSNYCRSLEDLGFSLHKFGHLAGNPASGFSEADAVECLERNSPACLEVQFGPAGHVLALSGIDTDAKRVRLHDPFTEDTIGWWNYEGNELRRNAVASNGDGWICLTTYQTKP
jgi:hypothetical protein